MSNAALSGKCTFTGLTPHRFSACPPWTFRPSFSYSPLSSRASARLLPIRLLRLVFDIHLSELKAGGPALDGLGGLGVERFPGKVSHRLARLRLSGLLFHTVPPFISNRFHARAIVGACHRNLGANGSGSQARERWLDRNGNGGRPFPPGVTRNHLPVGAEGAQRRPLNVTVSVPRWPGRSACSSGPRRKPTPCTRTRAFRSAPPSA